MYSENRTGCSLPPPHVGGSVPAPQPTPDGRPAPAHGLAESYRVAGRCARILSRPAGRRSSTSLTPPDPGLTFGVCGKAAKSPGGIIDDPPPSLARFRRHLAGGRGLTRVRRRVTRESRPR